MGLIYFFTVGVVTLVYYVTYFFLCVATAFSNLFKLKNMKVAVQRENRFVIIFV